MEVDFRGVGRRWVNPAYVPTYAASNMPDGWVAVLTDITGRKQTEQALRDSEERSRSVVNHVVDAIITIDEQGIIASFNPAAEGLFDYDAAEAIGRNVNLLMPEPYHSEHNGYISSYLRTGDARVIGIGREVVGRRKDRSVFPMDLAISEFQHGGRRYFTGIVRDITARKRAEESLREADRRKDEFLGMLAHELRNPLAAISYASQVLDRVGSLDDQAKRLLEIIRRQTTNLTRMVDDLLDMSRITSGKIQLVSEPLDVATVTERTVENIRPLMESRNHEFVVSMESRPLAVMGDATRLEQIPVNLLNNAARFTDSGGRIALTVELDTKSPATGAGEVVFRVVDNGIGIPGDMLPFVFDLFTQVDKSLDRSQGGLGIGLSLVQRLVELHGGIVSVASEGPGRESEFTVRLAAIPTTASMTSVPSTPRDRQSRRTRVLVVDDNSDVASSIFAVLRDLGHDADTASDGRSALEALRSCVPDLILIDRAMPVMDGFELARRLRGDPRFQRTLLVAVSGHGQDDDLRRTEEAGFDGHLAKPVSMATLEAALNATVEPDRFARLASDSAGKARGARYFVRRAAAPAT
jgi:PAS domain S-box-containing protein